MLPEHPSAIWTRRRLILLFWAVVLCLGLPHWTWTTSIHRSALPLESMNAWAEGRACHFRYPLHIHLQARHLPDDHLSALLSQVQALLDAQLPKALHEFRVESLPEAQEHRNQSTPSRAILTVVANTALGPSTPEASLRSWLPVLDVRHSIKSSSDINPAASFLAQEILKVFNDESSSLAYLLNGSPFAGPDPRHISPGAVARLDGRTTRAFKYASTYHLTFSLFTPSAAPSTWEVDRAMEKYIMPLLSPLSVISEFRVDTQVQLYASFSPSIQGPMFDEANNHWALRHEDLTGFVNAAEWPLSPSIGFGPTINFVLYVSPPDKSPLSIGDTGGTSWIIPQWGGVQIHNLANHSTQTLTVEDLANDMLIFADQLASLLGVPQTPPSLSLRISSLTRERATSLIISASSTLGALARLTLKLTSIAIPGSVATSVDETLHRLDQACQDLNEGRFESALKNARMAESEAEQAFFEPSMVGQVYFPEEHKVAVYVPLLGPMAVPLIMSGLKELRSLRSSKTKIT